MLRLVPLLAILSAAALMAGCDTGPKLPPLAPVSGLVTLDGVPLTRGTVQFVPDDRKNVVGPPAVGTIGPDGRYTLLTAGQNGAMVGSHRIRVEARAEKQGDWDTLPKSLVPDKYLSDKASGLTAEVKAGEQNAVDLPLVGK